MRLLEETLTHLSHGFLVFPHLLGDTHQHSELWREIDILALLLDFKQRLAHLHNLHVVLLFEVGRHGDCGSGFTLLEVAGLGAHVEAHIGYLVSLVVTVHGHHNRALELVNDSFVVLLSLGDVVRVALTFLLKSLDLVVNELEAVVNRQILADIVNDEIETSLENPGGREESRPGLYRVVEHLGLRPHKEARIAADLAQVRVAHLCLDDGVDEVEGEGVLLHAHLIEVIEHEFANALNQDSEFTAKERILSLEIDLVIVASGREDVVSDADVVDENLLKHGSLVLVAKNLVLLESLKVIDVKVADY